MAEDETGFKVVCANRLTDGRTVWLGAEGWVEQIAAAAPLAGAAAEAGLARARADVVANRVVDPYLTEVVLVNGLPDPLRRRERIRAFGPSIRPAYADSEAAP
jgi:sulfite reductase (NADPH) hemoprotein beta-component